MEGQKIWTEGLKSFWHIERCAEFIASKGDDAWPFVKIDRNTNITVPINKGSLASRLKKKKFFSIEI